MQNQTKTLAKHVGQAHMVSQDRGFWKSLGPGIVTGAADDDPSGIATYSQTGSQFGFGLLWLAAFSFPLMAIIQEMCARIGMVTGQGLAANIRQNFPKWVLYVCVSLLFFANSFNIGADLGAMAKAVQLFAPSLDFSLLIIFFAALCLILEIFISYKKYARVLKWLTITLLAYVFSAFFIHFDSKTVLTYALLPHLNFNKDEIFLICGILGTTISPYLFFWQTSQEVEEEILDGKASIKQRAALTTKTEIRNMRVDVWSGMFFSNLIMFFIILTCAATLFTHGITDIKTAADAASALKPFAGPYAFVLFGLGIIGTGLLAVPVLAGSAAYALAETEKWKEGLYRKFNQAHAFYGVIIASTLFGLAMNFTHLDPIKALIYAAVLNGLVAPIILILIVGMSGSKKIMGSHSNGFLANIFGWLVTGTMIIVGLATLIILFTPN
jgi:NRAMP (natural resistance-associated macrophage protein)-like metal ion transporter